jgi:hypothetical protein
MTIGPGARAALMLAAGLLVCLAAPVVCLAAPATAAGRDNATVLRTERATSSKSIRPSRYWKKRYASRKSVRAAAKSAESRTAADKEVADASDSGQPAIPNRVAEANAQMIPPDAAPDSARAMSEAMSAKAGLILLAAAGRPADAQAPADDAVPADAVPAADQLNDLDRTLQETPSEQTVGIAAARPASEAEVMAASNDSLDRTSLIGKILIAFGTLLTMASAARMLMA